jgi:hypothetical protein
MTLLEDGLCLYFNFETDTLGCYSFDEINEKVNNIENIEDEKIDLYSLIVICDNHNFIFKNTDEFTHIVNKIYCKFFEDNNEIVLK